MLALTLPKLDSFAMAKPQRKQPCLVCMWRNQVLPPPEPESPYSECHTPMSEIDESEERHESNKRIMVAMHSEPADIWKDILNTRTLISGRNFFVNSQHWFSFVTRNMRKLSLHPGSHHQTPTQYIEDYHGEIFKPTLKHGDLHETFVVYHCTRLVNLVAGH